MCKPAVWIQAASGTAAIDGCPYIGHLLASLKKQDRHNAGRNALVAGPVRRVGACERALYEGHLCRAPYFRATSGSTPRACAAVLSVPSRCRHRLSWWVKRMHRRRAGWRHHGGAPGQYPERGRAGSRKCWSACSRCRVGLRQSRSNRVLRGVGGAAAGSALARACWIVDRFPVARSCSADEHHRDNYQQAGLRVGDCVSVERGQFNNLRLVDDARRNAAANTPVPASATAEAHAVRCRQGSAAERVVTDADFALAERRMRLLCGD